MKPAIFICIYVFYFIFFIFIFVIDMYIYFNTFLSPVKRKKLYERKGKKKLGKGGDHYG
jgi:hypothetical protein